MTAKVRTQAKRHYMLARTISEDCEHCDGERSRLVRRDYLRGQVCDVCDNTLDEMLALLRGED